jgi:hypothetical protein
MRARLVFALLLVAGASAQASETITYSYDPRGRLIKVAHSGTVNNGVRSCYTYDKADNRTNQAVVTSGDCTSGNGGSLPPTPVNDSGTQPKCTTANYNVTANDTDPEGDYPLTVTNVTGSGNWGIASASEVSFTSLNSTGAKVGTYTVRDSMGATATATLTVTVSGGTCTQ